MSTAFSPAPAIPRRKILVTRETRRIPEFVRQLNQWQYMERALHRLLAAWGRHHTAMSDKAALHRHIWDQAEVVRRLRGRISEFPGGNPDAPVPHTLEGVANAALFAPSFDDALDGIYHLLLRPLLRAYVEHAQAAHPIHDGPTLALLHEINTIKEQQFLWYRDFRRRRPHTTDADYRQKIEAAIAVVGGFRFPVDAVPEEEPAQLCGLGSGFALPRLSARPPGWRPAFDLMPYISADFSASPETRRLFWAIGYLREINLPDDQLRWLYYGHDMPWDWHYDVSRHLWDESRHGLSGWSRLCDWGIEISEVGLPPYNLNACLRHASGSPLIKRIINPYLDDERIGFLKPGAAMSAKDLYDEVFDIGLVAESGHFIVKNESYDDFKLGADLESAEMMLFDIIDETAHVQYAHKWLPLLAEKAGIDNGDYRKRAAQIRIERQEDELRLAADAVQLPRADGYPPWDHYQDLLRRIREQCPFAERFSPPPRSPKPM